MSKRLAIIMAGGSGERFWPLSRAGRPKQLLRLTHPDQTMLEEAVNRVAPLVGKENVVLAIGGSIESAVRDAQIVPDSCVWAEPAKRNTLGCLAWAAANLLARGDDDASIAVLTADHTIGEPERFRETVLAALEIAEAQDAIVTIGIRPDRPETGYGYIEADHSQEVSSPDGRVAYRSLSFREKPSAETAKHFLEVGNFLWNSGMFFFPLPAFMRELGLALPETEKLVRSMATALAAGDSPGAAQLFESVPSISIDFAVMEKAERIFVVPSDFPWDDMGAWDALKRSFALDANGNVVQGRAILVDSHDSIVYNDLDTGTIGVLGMDRVVVVATENAVLVCREEDVQRVREIVQQLRSPDAK